MFSLLNLEDQISQPYNITGKFQSSPFIFIYQEVPATLIQTPVTLLQQRTAFWMYPIRLSANWTTTTTESFVISLSISMRLTGYCVKCLVIHDAVQFGKHVPTFHDKPVEHTSCKQFSLSISRKYDKRVTWWSYVTDRRDLHIRYSLSFFKLTKNQWNQNVRWNEAACSSESCPLPFHRTSIVKTGKSVWKSDENRFLSILRTFRSSARHVTSSIPVPFATLPNATMTQAYGTV